MQAIATIPERALSFHVEKGFEATAVIYNPDRVVSMNNCTIYKMHTDSASCQHF